MKIERFNLAVLVGCVLAGVKVDAENVQVEKGSSDMNLLRKVYNLKSSDFAPYDIAVTYGDESCPAPIATSYIQVHEEVCGVWNVFTLDRLFMWHKGQVMIDIINEDGTYDSMCLGDTLEDENCKYVIHIPPYKTIDLRTQGYAIFSGIVLAGNGHDGKSLTFQEVEQAYAQIDLTQALSKTEACTGPSE